MADIARTIDHLSGGRFILGIGSGYLQKDYDEYGYEYGTVASRTAALARNLPIIRDRLGKLNPPPLRRMPILIAAMGAKVGLRVVAEHADIWQVDGTLENMAEKIGLLKEHCAAIGRDWTEIEFSTSYLPGMLPDADPDKYRALGIRHIYTIAQGPDWDMGVLRELLSWKKSLG
jgi:alkanesulfonate monooxygenase SsuD/methylene tetrahydromethanopterin reductase-like flavin-dependent oxidoreductase (luciferase family)